MKHPLNQPERILCAAIYVDDGKPHAKTHPYPKTGLLFCGWRHADCFASLRVWSATLPEDERAVCNMRDYGRVAPEVATQVTEAQARAMRDSIRGFDQGFLTSKGRYVTREEGAEIALAAGQIERPVRGLTSEDVW